MSDTEYGHDALLNDLVDAACRYSGDIDAMGVTVAFRSTLEAAHREPVSDDADLAEVIGRLEDPANYDFGSNGYEMESFDVDTYHADLATITTALTAAQSERDAAIRLAQTASDFACELATYDELVQSVGEWNDAQGEESA